MAASLVESLAADFDPSEFEDTYAAALEALIEAKVTSGSTVSVRAGAEEATAEGGEVVDLLSALQRSVERARDARGGGAATSSTTPAAKKPAAKKPAAKRPAAKATPKQGAAKEPAAKESAKKPAARRRAS